MHVLILFSVFLFHRKTEVVEPIKVFQQLVPQSYMMTISLPPVLRVDEFWQLVEVFQQSNLVAPLHLYGTRLMNYKLLLDVDSQSLKICNKYLNSN